MKYILNCKVLLSFVLMIANASFSIVLGETYYMRADGTSSDKTTATACTNNSTAMSIDTHNEQTFYPGDVVALCDDGGLYKSSIIAPSSGSDNQPVTYKNADGDTPIIDLSVDIEDSSAWDNVGGGVYRIKGYARVLWEDDVPLKAASSKSLTDGDWFYPNGSHQLYYRPTSGTPTEHTVQTIWFDTEWAPYAIDLRNKSNITVQGITIRRTGGGIGHGQKKSSPVSPITNISIHKNTISECMWGIWSQVFKDGIESDVLIYDNNISYCNSGISAWTGSDKEPDHTQRNLRFSVTGNMILNLYSISDSLVWSDALLKSYYYTDHEGISFQDVQDSVISDNTITTTFAKDMTSDQFWCRAIYLYLTNGRSATTGNTIMRNYISGHFYPSIYVSSAKGIKGFENNTIAYNLIHYPGLDKGQISFEVNMASANPLVRQNYFINNTVVNNAEGLGIYFYNQLAGNWIIKNNIIDSPSRVVITDANNAGNLTFGNNLYPEADTGFMIGTAGMSFAKWKDTYNYDERSSSDASLFISREKDFRLQPTSPAIDASQPVKSKDAKEDIESSPIYGLPDIGAYEFQPAFQNSIEK